MTDNEFLLSFGPPNRPGREINEPLQQNVSDPASDQHDRSSATADTNFPPEPPGQSEQSPHASGSGQGGPNQNTIQHPIPSHWARFATLVDLQKGVRERKVKQGEAVARGVSYLASVAEIGTEAREAFIRDFVEDLQRERCLGTPDISPGDELGALETILDRAAEGEDEGRGIRGGKRRRSPGDEEERGRSRRVAEEEYPWYESSRRFAEESLSESVRHTRRIVEVTRSDVSSAIHSVRRSPDAPPNFPISEWSNILHGRSVDLNNVFSNLHLLQPVRESTGSVGGVSVHVTQVEKNKTIRTANDWGSAWRKTSQATAVVFPHRRGELDRYGEYIDSLFTSTTIATHPRIILYDEAVRGFVGGGETYSFDDKDSYQRLQTAFLFPGGIEANRGGMGRGRGDPKEICRRFNGKVGGCPNGADCRYRHVCQLCGSNAHGRTGCTRGQQGPTNQS